MTFVVKYTFVPKTVGAIDHLIILPRTSKFRFFLDDDFLPLCLFVEQRLFFCRYKWPILIGGAKMSKAIETKKVQVQEIAEKFKAAASVVVVDYRGLNVVASYRIT